MQKADLGTHKTKWTIRKYINEAARLMDRPYDVSVFENNLLLEEGIGEHMDLLAGLGGYAFSNELAFLGVGDSTTAAAANQTGLQAVTNKLYKAMSTGYPQRSGQTLTWQAVFGANEANFAWNEFTVANGNTDSAKNLNRKVDPQGEKPSGHVWTLELAITFS